MELSGAQHEHLCRAFLSAFRQPLDLKIIARHSLEVDLYTAISSEQKTLEEIVFDLIRYAESYDKMNELIKGALNRNPSNKQLERCGIEMGIVTAKHSLKRLPLDHSLIHKAETVAVRPQNALFTSEDIKENALHQTPYYREEIFLSRTDAERWKIDQPITYAILTVQSLLPGKPVQQYGVRLVIDRAQKEGCISINEHFSNHRLGKKSGLSWFISPARKPIPIKKVVFDLPVERRDIEIEIKELRKNAHLFQGRCLLVEQKNEVQTLSLPMEGYGYFKLYKLEPEPQKMPENSLLIIDEKTDIRLFVSYRKSGVDMLMLIDGSGSMDTEDYVMKNKQRYPRLMAVQEALRTLIRRRSLTGSHVSKIAIMVFGKKTAMLYPSNKGMEELVNREQISAILQQIPEKLKPEFIETLNVNRYNTNISNALREAANILDHYCKAGNEKLLILVSDGADWKESTDDSRYGEIASALEEPAALAASLHKDSQIRIHTIGITTQKQYQEYEQQLKQGKKDAVVANTAPDPALLQKIATSTGGLYFESLDTQALNKIFDEIGQGTIYPLNGWIRHEDGL